MRIYLVRHGQTNLNLKKLMQGRTDEPLNETGREQAGIIRDLLKDVTFDVVYASPLDRAIETACVAGRTSRNLVRIDDRLIETDFGIYEKRPYSAMGLKMSLYWALPEIFPAPESVETIRSMTERASSFLKELEGKTYENVLIAAHGGILRALNGYLLDRKNGIRWRPKMHNCEVRVYEVTDGRHTFVKTLRAEGSEK